MDGRDTTFGVAQQSGSIALKLWITWTFFNDNTDNYSKRAIVLPVQSGFWLPFQTCFQEALLFYLPFEMSSQRVQANKLILVW